MHSSPRSDGQDAPLDGEGTATKSCELVAAPTLVVMKRFGDYLPLMLWAAAFYWIFACVAVAGLTKGQLGQDRANLLGFAVATLLVPGAMYAYAHFVCSKIAQSKVLIDDNGLTILAMQRFTANKYHFILDDIERVVFGEKLNSAEQLFDFLHQLRIARNSMSMVKDVKAGRLFVVRKTGDYTAFQYFDKAFDEAQILTMLSVLHLRGIPIQVDI